MVSRSTHDRTLAKFDTVNRERARAGLLPEVNEHGCSRRSLSLSLVSRGLFRNTSWKWTTTLPTGLEDLGCP